MGAPADTSDSVGARTNTQWWTLACTPPPTVIAGCPRSPWVGRGGAGEEEIESDSSLPGSLPLGQVTPEESQSGSDSSFVGDSLVEAAAMVATTTGSGGGRRYHTRQVAREARGLRPIGAAANEDGVSYYGADEGDSNEGELGGDSSVGGGIGDIFSDLPARVTST